jgi:hypothetical protein
MPTLVAVLSLVLLIKLLWLGWKPWELALAYVAIVGVALAGSVGPRAWLLDLGASYAAVFAWLRLLDRSDAVGTQTLHWLLLIGGLLLLVASRLWIDLKIHGLSL